jgi:hypothetical protein
VSLELKLRSTLLLKPATQLKKFLWVNRAPLGGPVVPLVKEKLAQSSKPTVISAVAGSLFPSAESVQN